MLAAVLLLCAPAVAGSAGDEQVVATVNGQAITYRELVNELLVRNGVTVLEDLVRDRALDQEIARAGVTASEREIDLAIAEERSRFDAARTTGGPASYEDFVAERFRMSIEGYRAVVRRWIVVRKLLLKSENPAEDELALWFYRNRERYDEPAQVTARHILIAHEDPVSGKRRSEEDIRARIAAVRSRLIAGEDFGRIARAQSDDLGTKNKGGDLGTVDARTAEAHLEPTFYQAMMALRPGQATGPVETPKGYHFLQVTARKEGREVKYEEVSDLVRRDYLEERALLRREIFVRDLMERTSVKIYFEQPTRMGPERRPSE